MSNPYDTMKVLEQATAKVNGELFVYLRLTRDEINLMVHRAHRAADPVEKLVEILTTHAKAKREQEAARKRARIEQDLKMLMKPESWPSNCLRLKSQPWITERDGEMRFAKVYSWQVMRVIPDEGEPIIYDGMTALVEEWSVD